MAPFANFIGGFGRGRASQADAERTINFYVENVDEPSGRTKTDRMLLGKPGLKKFAALGSATSVASLISCNERVFGVAGGQLYEISSDGTVTLRGTVASSTQAGTRLCASQTQLLIVVRGNGWIFDLRTNVLTRITADGWPGNVTAIAFIDGYFIVLEGDSQKFAISGLNNGLSWNALDFGDAEGDQGNVTGMIADHRLLWLLRNTTSQGYYNAGNANFPFSRVEGAFMDQGCGAVASPVNFDNTIAWLSQNRDGARMVWRANGYTPSRISTHAMEAQLSKYPRVDDAVFYTCQIQGHTFLHMDFPSANDGHGACWVYDAASNECVEWLWWKADEGQYYSDLARTHCYAFGKHLVGDWRSGNVYEMSTDYATDNGAAIRRVRAAPAISRGGKFLFFHELRLLCQVGVGREITASDMQVSQLTFPLTTMPWEFTGGINADYQFGDDDGLPPAVVPVEPGSVVVIRYISGGGGSGGFLTPDGFGDRQWGATADKPGDGTYFPTKYMLSDSLGQILCIFALVGAFADDAGSVIQPLAIGNGATFTAPPGAKRLQLGVNDDLFHDNAGSFTVSVSVTTAPAA